MKIKSEHFQLQVFFWLRTIYYGVNKKYERCNKSSHWLSNWLQLNEVEQKCIRERET